MGPLRPLERGNGSQKLSAALSHFRGGSGVRVQYCGGPAGDSLRGAAVTRIGGGPGIGGGSAKGARVRCTGSVGHQYPRFHHQTGPRQRRPVS